MFTKIKIFVYLFLLLFAPFSIPQTLPPYPICGTDEISSGVIPSTGNIKALIIFVKFQNDMAPSADWDHITYAHSRPPWTEQMIASSPSSELYHPSISGYCDQLSSGQCKIYGGAFPPYPEVFEPLLNIEDYTKQSPPYCYGTRDISWVVYEALTSLDEQINYADYDENNDGYVDFIIMWFRLGYFNITDCSGYDGMASLTGTNEYFMGNIPEIVTNDLKNGQPVKIRKENGLIANGYSPRKIDIMVHEISHLMGQFWHFPNDHLGLWCLSDARTGVGIPSTMERGDLGWLLPDPITVIEVPGTYNLTLQDYEATGKSIRITTQYNGKYRIENRSGLMFYSKVGNWVMPGNGLLIYEGEVGVVQTVECADHVWNWETSGIVDCDPNTCANRHNLKFVYNNGLTRILPNISGIKDLDLFGVCTNIGCYTHPGASGDAGDLYNPEYNTVFSRWSNPICAFGPGGNPIVIELLGKNSDSSVNILIKYDLADAYLGTHPSKPMWLRTSKHYFEYNKFHPKLEWLNNTEPDVISGGRYNIFRGLVTQPGVEPNYVYAGYVNYPTNVFIDNYVSLYDRGGGSGSCEYQYRLWAYKISVVDNELLESVRSDKATIDGYANPCEEEDKISLSNNNLPEKFNIYNYPNPFNPTTEIRFSLPVAVNVTIKVYNLLGEELVILVNNKFFNSGNYSVKFDGTNYASGLYVYRIEAGSFTESKKMLLIK